MLAGVIDYSIMLRMSNWMGETLATEVTFECSAESFEPALQPRLLCWATGLFFWHRRWTENHWNFSGPHADPLITMKVAWHQVDITLPWIHHRKPFLHCCFNESYINTYPSFFLFLMSLYRTVTVFHSLVPLSLPHFILCFCWFYFNLSETGQELIGHWKFFPEQYCTLGFIFVGSRSNIATSAM